MCEKCTCVYFMGSGHLPCIFKASNFSRTFNVPSNLRKPDFLKTFLLFFQPFSAEAVLQLDHILKNFLNFKISYHLIGYINRFRESVVESRIFFSSVLEIINEWNLEWLVNTDLIYPYKIQELN